MSKRACRVCEDFQTFSQKTHSSTTRRSSTARRGTTTDQEKEGPLDSSRLGNCSWSLLHTMAAYYPAQPSLSQQYDMDRFIKLFSKLYPCEVCSMDFQQDLKQHPPWLGSGDAFQQWLCDRHNQVNRKLGKPIFDCSKVKERWGGSEQADG